MTKLKADGWRTQIASDILHRDGLALELLDPSGAVVAEVFRDDGEKRVRVTTFQNEVPFSVFLEFCHEASSRLDPFEDGTPLKASRAMPETASATNPSLRSVKLSLQRALLGEVFPALRRVTFELLQGCLHFYSYVEGEPREEDLESLECVLTEVIADFWREDFDIQHQVIRVDPPELITSDLCCVYSRREKS